MVNTSSSYREIERRERSRDKRVVRFEREESTITALIVLFRRIGGKIQQTKENLIILFFVDHPFFKFLFSRLFSSLPKYLFFFERNVEIETFFFLRKVYELWS